jgi:hypothetical protein
MDSYIPDFELPIMEVPHRHALGRGEDHITGYEWSGGGE